MLTSVGLDQNQILFIIDSATGQIEYAIKVTDQCLQKAGGGGTDVFKAIWQNGTTEAPGPTQHLALLTCPFLPCYRSCHLRASDSGPTWVSLGNVSGLSELMPW